MAGKNPAGGRPVAVHPADVTAMATMARIAERAGSGAHIAPTAPPTPPAPPSRPDTPPPAGVSGGQLHEARVLLSEQNVVGPTRLKLAKRLVMRGSRLFTHRLVGASLDIADAVEGLERTHGAAIADVQRGLAALGPSGEAERDTAARISRLELDNNRLGNSLHAQLTSVELGVDDVAAKMAATAASLQEDTGRLRDQIRALEARLSATERGADHDRSELHRTRTLVNRLVRTAVGPARSGGVAGAPGDSGGDGVPDGLGPGSIGAGAIGAGTIGTAPGTPPPTLDDATYLDFEHRFRGTSDEIRARQKDAARFVAGLSGAAWPVLDLGCGRGEWLDLLAELRVPGYGVDSNAAMVSAAVEAGVDARLGDALEHLEDLAGSSLQGVTAFHFVEHVPLDVLVRLLDSALVALRPGGTLLLETPNPTNLIVGAANFYLDPTHLRPLHPDFLAFLVESRGFVDVQIHYVHPVIAEDVLEQGQFNDLDHDPRMARVVRNVEWALFGPQDYLVYARRAEVA